MTTTLHPETLVDQEETQPIAEPVVEKGGSRRRWALVAGIITVALAAGAWLLIGTPATDVVVTDEPTALNTAVVEQQDIVDFLELDGTLTFADPITWFSATDGTVTAVVEVGAVLEQGDVVVELDEQPVVLLYGDIPPYRMLAQGVDPGEDVAQLEENLVLLGYDEDFDIVIDGKFDSATEAAVEAWQDDLGVEITGVVGVGDYLVGSGPVQVQTVGAEWGVRLRADGVIAGVVAVTSDGVVVSPIDGVVLGTVSTGSLVATGDIVLQTTDASVPAVVGVDPFEADLAEGDEGTDVEQLEEVLLALGYDAGGDLDVDQTYDGATAEALSAWEAGLGIDQDGVFQVSQVVVIPEGFVASEVLVEPGDDVAVGQPILESSESARIVTTQIDVVDQTKLSVGDVVSVELADGSVIEAVVADISAVAQLAPNEPDAEPYLEVVLDISAASIALELVESPVTVSIVDSIAEDATVVPASALVALREGGYAIEVVSGGSNATRWRRDG